MAGKPEVLGDHVSLVRGTTYKGALLGKPGPVLLGLATIAPEGGFRSDNYKTYGGDSPEKLLLRPGELFVSLKDVTQAGSLLGAVARLPSYIQSGRLTQDTVKIVATNKNSRLDYIYWLLRSPQYRTYCKSMATGTTNLGLAREDFLSFPVPELTPERSALCRLLDLIDDRVELNRRMIEPLESISRTLFKSWFIDFDPIQAKIENRSTGLSNRLDSIFPDTMGSDGLPDGWTPTPLSKIGRFLNGLALQKFPPEDGKPSLPVIKIAELRSGPTKKSGRASAEVPPDYVVEDGDHLFSWSGSLTHCRWTHGKGALNQHLFKVTPLDVPSWLTYQSVEHHLPEFQAIAAGKAVTMGHIQRHHLDEAIVALPPTKVLKVLDGVMGPLHKRALIALLQIRTLTTLREALLPRLIAGDLHVRSTGNTAAAA